jgi:schlafen family protein
VTAAGLAWHDLSVVQGYGWAGSVAEFLSSTEPQFLASLDAHHRALWNVPAAGSQRKAWSDEFHVMGTALRACVEALPHEAARWSVIFEFEMPFEGGRRPDVVVLSGKALVVLEFKSSSLPDQATVDQVFAYARDLTDYHRASHDLAPYPMVVLTGAAPGMAVVWDQVVVTAPEGLESYLFDARRPGTVDLAGWLSAPYDPLPSLIEAARRIFQHEPLPHVKRALAAGLPETVELFAHLTQETADRGERLLAFVTGVPGAGKTLVGLRLVYERSSEAGRATFLSGNGPLVTVLQDALRSRVFVRDLHAFIRTYGINETTEAPQEHVLVFDEAQRAWDRQYQRTKRQVDASEPDLLVRIGERVPTWSALVGLVGDGQEIHSGEEAGLGQWRDAAQSPNATLPWKVHCPPKLADTFAGLPVQAHERLDLKVSMRNRRAERFHDWVALLLDGSIPEAGRRALPIQTDGFPMYITRDLDEAKEYVQDRYVGQPAKRYGLLASSHAKGLDRLGVDNGYMATSRMNIAKWYNAPGDDPSSCCALIQPVTEFGCQGLELDLPILCWGPDAMWKNGEWQLNPVRRRYPQTDPEQLLTNTYRVLLTRGRDGVVIWVPPLEVLDETEHILLAAGVRGIPAASVIIGEEIGA